MNKREAPKSENFPVTDQKDQYKKKKSSIYPSCEEDEKCKTLTPVSSSTRTDQMLSATRGPNAFVQIALRLLDDPAGSCDKLYRYFVLL